MNASYIVRDIRQGQSPTTRIYEVILEGRTSPLEANTFPGKDEI